MISFDTETTGVNLRHGAKPFLVVVHDSETDLTTFWEWDVDPLTRQPQVPQDDLDQIFDLIQSTDKVILQNAKFDVSAMAALDKRFEDEWPWDKTHDTLMLGHLLDSNKPHDLTSMVSQYLGVDIGGLEDSLKKAVQEGRREVGSKSFQEQHGVWRTAKQGLPEMPSCKETAWRYDYWLPRALALYLSADPSEPHYTVLSDYATGDAVYTLALYQVQVALVEQQGLMEIYNERRKLLRVIQKMEAGGVTLNKDRLEKLTKEYEGESETISTEMVGIAAQKRYELTLPKSGSNKSLHGFCYDAANGLKLPIVATTDTGAPSLNKLALEAILDALKEQGRKETDPDYRFVHLLVQKRKRDTALGYIESYRSYWKPLRVQTRAGEWVESETDCILYPSLNPTGTNTLRFSSSNPNEQNISKKEGFNLRYAFGPAEGREWWSIDYENIELRIPAYESGEQAMIELFERPDDPPYFGSYHLLNCSIVYPDEFREVVCRKCLGVGCTVQNDYGTKTKVPCTPQDAWVPICNIPDGFKKRYKSTLYQDGKNGGFAIQYGCQEKKADTTFKRKGAFKAIKGKLPKVTQLSDHYVVFANRYGYVETIPDQDIGSKRGYPMKIQRLERGQVSPTIPFSYHIQGTAMWCTSKAMPRCQNQLDVWNKLDPTAAYRIVMQVHDEMDFDFPYVPNRGNYPKVLKLARLMEQSGKDIRIPLRTSISYHPNNWSEEVK